MGVALSWPALPCLPVSKVADQELIAALTKQVAELQQRITDIERSIPMVFRVAQYNILASYLGNNMEPWFLYGGLSESEADRQRALNVAQKHRAKSPDGGYLYSGWPAYAHGILTEEEIARVEQRHREVFAWEMRGPRVARVIEELNADLVSLVELDQYEEFFCSKFELMGYGSSWFKRPRTSSNDGCAVLYRRSKFDLVAEHAFHYNDSECGENMKDRAALLVLLRFRRNSYGERRRLIFCSTHLAKNPQDSGVQQALRVRQTAQLFRELYKFAANHNCIHDAPVIIGGDYNATSMNEIRVICEAIYNISSAVLPHPMLWGCADVPTGSTSYTNERAMRIDYLLFEETFLHLKSVDKVPVPDGPIPCERHPSDHLPVCAEFQMKSETDVMRDCALRYCRIMLGQTTVLRGPLRGIELSRAFDYIDGNRDGVVSRDDFLRAIRSLEVAITGGEASELWRTCTNHLEENQPLCFTGFKTAYDNLVAHHNCSLEFTAAAKRAFSYFNSDGSGLLSQDMLRSVLRTVSPAPIDTHDEQKIISEADVNSDGFVDLAEFVGMCLQASNLRASRSMSLQKYYVKPLERSA